MDRRGFLKNLFKMATYGPIAELADTLSEDPNIDKRSGRGTQIVRRTYQRTVMTLPLLGFGMMRLPEKNGEIDQPAAEAMIAYALEHGCN